MVVVGVALVLVVVLAVTGVLLWFRYRPTPDAAWSSLPGFEAIGRSEPVERSLHRWASRLLIPVTLLVAVSGVGARWQRGRRVPWPIAAFGLAVVASISGFLLPWDQLALWAVTVDTRIEGIQALFDDQVRSVLIGGAEISPVTYRRWAVIHVVLGVAIVAAVIPRRRSRVE